MIAISIIHIAILTNFAVAHAADKHFDFQTAMQPAARTVDQLRRCYAALHDEALRDKAGEQAWSNCQQGQWAPADSSCLKPGGYMVAPYPAAIPQQYTYPQQYTDSKHLSRPIPDTPVEVGKVVLQDTTLWEKFGLGAVPADSECGLITVPTSPPDEETIALTDKARHFVSSIDWIAKRKIPPPAKPDLPIHATWTKRFAVQWDDDGGFTLGGKYVPKPECVLTDCWPGGLDLTVEYNR